MPFINCADATLAPFIPSTEKPWDQQRAIHLYRRIGLGANLDQINSVLSQDPVDLVRSLIQEAVDMPQTPEPEWGYWQINDYDPDPQTRNEQITEQILGWGVNWMINMKERGLKDRMSFFWHNHFVTRLEDYGCPSWMYQYQALLEKHALGNFKQFVYDIGLTPAMLVFLNGIQNIVNNGNENYARELYELFTLGVDNGYTQADIVDTARALTGWNGIDLENLCGEVTFIPFAHDNGEKTIFGRTGNWGYDDVINILFEERAVEISEYICGKLYRHFVNPKEDLDIIEELAVTFRNNNWELAPVLEQLFTSEHFFDIAHIGTVIPGHIEYFITFINEMNYETNYDLMYFILFAAGQVGQNIFNPINVAGWIGNRNWVTSSAFSVRSQGVVDSMGYYYQAGGNDFSQLINLAIGLTSDFETDAKKVTDAIINYFLPKGLQFSEEYEEALKIFKADIPENYFDLGQWSLQWDSAPAQVYYLIAHLANLPEFQLK